MKKQLLFGLSVLFAFSAFTQNSSSILMPVFNKQIMDNSYSLPAIFPKQDKNPVVSPQSVSAIQTRTLGTTGNAFSLQGIKTFLWADPVLNAITLSHRSVVGSGTAASGYLTYDVSKDGGANWLPNVVSVYTPTAAAAAYGARYPQGVIYNPPSNTSNKPDSAYFCTIAPTRDGSNPNSFTTPAGDWGGLTWGAHQLSGLKSPVQIDTSSNTSPSTTGYFFYVPEDMFITKSGVIHTVQPMRKGSDKYVYCDTIIYSVGKWNPTINNMAYTRKKIRIPLSDVLSGVNIYKAYTDMKIAFADDELTGYISIIGHNNYTFRPDSTYYIITYKTIDGGANWVGPTNIPVDNVAPLLVSNGISQLTTGFEHDIVVDSLKNLHIAVVISSAGETDAGSGIVEGWSIAIGPGRFGLFDVYTVDQGASWRAKLLRRPMSFIGVYGVSSTDAANPAMQEYLRAQPSRSWDGEKLFFSWFETDTSEFGATPYNDNNANPDMHAIGYDVVTGNWTNQQDFTGHTTGGTNVVGANTFMNFGSTSYYALRATDNRYEIPCAFGRLTSDNRALSGENVNLFYLQGVGFNNSEYTVPGYVDLASLGINSREADNNRLGVSQNYPNPFNKITQFYVTLSKASNVFVEVYNSIGQLVISQNAKNLSAGTHPFNIDGSVLNKGIYFYTVKTNEQIVTKQMMVE